MSKKNKNLFKIPAAVTYRLNLIVNAVNSIECTRLSSANTKMLTTVLKCNYWSACATPSIALRIRVPKKSLGAAGNLFSDSSGVLPVKRKVGVVYTFCMKLRPVYLIFGLILYYAEVRIFFKYS